MDDKRLLNINPELFSLTNNTTRKKTRKTSEGGGIRVKETNKDFKREETLRNKAALLRMLRRKQEEKYQEMFDKRNSLTPNHPQAQSQSQSQTPNNDFEEAKLFMDNLVKRQDTVKNYTVKQYPQHQSSHHQTPPQQAQRPIEYVSDFIGKEPVNTSGTMYLKPPTNPTNHIQPNRNPFSVNTTIRQRPMINGMSTQSGGSTVEYSQNQYQVHEPIQPQQSIVSANATHIMEQKINDSLRRINEMKQTATKLQEYKEKTQPKILKQKKTRRRTYKIGKSKVLPRISVLVSNKTIRKDITTKTQLLKQVPIQDIKKYLMKRGFIKVGSVAPNDVLRKMYESAILICGDVQNHNPDNLLYNFLNNDTHN